MPQLTIEKSTGLKASQKGQAEAMDRLMEVFYGRNGLPDAVLHGGAAIWRCYGSSRFSPDADFYSSYTDIVRLAQSISESGFNILGLRDTGGGRSGASGVIFGTVSLPTENRQNRVTFSITRVDVAGTIADYTKVDGSKMDIVTLNPESFMREKINAYNSRGKINDLYDLYHLVTKVVDFSALDRSKSEELLAFLKKVSSSPADRVRDKADYETLKSVVYAPTVPDQAAIMEAFRRAHSNLESLMRDKE
jgi:predicted nucleotidyltransferase component of viral defense system